MTVPDNTQGAESVRRPRKVIPDTPGSRARVEEALTEMRQSAESARALKRAGQDLNVWLDFYANVCPATKDDLYAAHSREAIAAWESLVDEDDPDLIDGSPDA